MDSMRVALIGAGNIAINAHVPCLLRLGVNVVSVLDPSEAALNNIRDCLPRNVRYIRSETLDLPDGIDCAVVCSPAALHFRQVRELLERDIHVLSEKPLTCSGAEARELAELAARRKRVLQVGYIRRFHPSTQAVKTLLRNGELGAPRACTVRAGHFFSDASDSLTNKSLSGGGILTDMGCHVIDEFYNWFDELTLSDYSDDFQGGVEVNAVVRFEGVVKGWRVPLTAALSWTNPLGHTSVVAFEQASVMFRLGIGDGHEIRVLSPKPVKLLGRECYPAHSVRLSPPVGHVDYFCRQWLEFNSRIAGEPERLSCLADAVRTAAMVDTCYASRRTLALGWGL